MTRSRGITGLLILLLFTTVVSLGGCGAPEDSTSLSSISGRGYELSQLENGLYVVMRVDDDGLLQVARAGFKQTRCSDGVMRSTCAVAELELSRVDMRADDDALARARIADGSAVVLAKLVANDSVRDGVLVISEIWTRDIAAPARRDARVGSDPLFVLRDVHEGCDRTLETCAWLRTESSNGDVARHYTSLDLEPTGSGLTDDQRDELRHGRLLAHGAGIGSVFVVASLLRVFPPSAITPATPSVALTTKLAH